MKVEAGFPSSNLYILYDVFTVSDSIDALLGLDRKAEPARLGLSKSIAAENEEGGVSNGSK